MYKCNIYMDSFYIIQAIEGSTTAILLYHSVAKCTSLARKNTLLNEANLLPISFNKYIKVLYLLS